MTGERTYVGPVLPPPPAAAAAEPADTGHRRGTTGDWTKVVREIKASIATQEGRFTAAIGELTAAIASSEQRQTEALSEFADTLNLRREGDELADMSAKLHRAEDTIAAERTARHNAARQHRRDKTGLTARLGSLAAILGTLAAAFFAAFLDRSASSEQVVEQLERQLESPPVVRVPVPIPPPEPAGPVPPTELERERARIDAVEAKLDQILERLPKAKGRGR